MSQDFNQDQYTRQSANDRASSRAWNGDRERRPVLTLRQLSRGGDFIRSVQCQAGQITIITGESGSGYQPFRDSLLGRHGPVPVSLRFDGAELNPSEVYAVGLAHYVWTESSVRGVLTAAGVAAEDTEPLLESLGLLASRDSSPRTLGECGIRRLAIICSLYSQAKVIVFDRPFAPVEPKWWDVLATMMLEKARESSQILIVTGLERIPNIWRSSPFVRTENVDFVKRKTIGFSGAGDEESATALSTVRTLLAYGSPAETEDNLIRTRPQRITKPSTRVAVPEALQTEAITNPRLSEMLNMAGDETGSDDVIYVGRGERRRSSMSNASTRRGNNHLTRISVIQRLSHRSRIMHALRSLRRSFNALLRRLNVRESIPTGAKATLRRKQQEQQKFVFEAVTTLVVFVVIAILIALFSG